MAAWKPITAAATITGLLVALYLARDPASELLVAATERVQAMGPLAPVAFGTLYTVTVLALLPVTPLLLAAGMLFGLTLGTVYGLVANTLAGVLAFACSRRFARSLVERHIGRHDEIRALDRALRAGGLRAAFLIRLSPALPASLINYGLGLTSIRFVHYLAASLATVPFVFLYVYYGKALGELALLGSGRGPDRGVGYYALLGGGVAATLLVTVWLTRRARRLLEQDDE